VFDIRKHNVGKKMGDSEVLAVRFHFNGVFVVDGSLLNYCNGDEGISHIEKDKLSIPELEGHLLDHTIFRKSVRMYWLPCGAAVHTGMMMLIDDKSCLDMLDAVGSVGIVDIYTEEIDVDMAAMTDVVETIRDEDVFDMFRDENVLNLDGPATHEDAQNGTEDEEDDLEDEGIECEATGFTSDEDDEAKEIRTKYKAYMSKRKKKEGIPLDTPTSMDQPTVNDSNIMIPVNDGVPYFDSDEDFSYDDDSETDAKRRKCRFPIFDRHAETPQFALDMCFRGRKELKDAIAKYALKMKVNIRFPKNDNQRLRAVCSWKGCPWLLHASYNSKTDWFQIVTYNPNHACCPVLKNKRLSTARICDKYESTIKANPAWKARAMKETIQEDMGVEVSLTMVKRAKVKVIKKVMDARSGEYARLFDYALELKRSNPGSSVHIALDPEEEENVFHRMYICLDACRRGFLHGCRRVIGLDGCFLKGPMKGELLSAIGRDANNQIYPIAWAVVEYENLSSWKWFLGHLQKDVQPYSQCQMSLINM
jgi:hypothetical protein